MNIYLLIDQSGSMITNWTETIGAVNSYIRGLIGNKNVKGLRINIAAFDSDADLRFTEIRRNVKAKLWADITDKDAEPRGMTPLYDAIGRLSAWVDSDKPQKAAVAIITDGQENSSREVTKATARAFLDKMRDKNFDVVFLGADFDAFGEAASVGTQAGQTLNMTAGSYRAAASSLSQRTTMYAETGAIADFSDDDRRVAKGEDMGLGDDPFAKALKAGAEGKTPGGRQLPKGQRLLIAGLKGPRDDSPRTRSRRRMRLNGSGSK
jgi:uncharacterized protein YegL